MPRFSLRTLILVMLLGGPGLAIAWWVLRSGWIMAAFFIYCFVSIVWLSQLTYRNERVARAARRQAMKEAIQRKMKTLAESRSHAQAAELPPSRK